MSTRAIGEILAIQPSAKFIVILRNPVEMAHALHGELLYNLTEDREDFAEAWDLQEPRARGKHVPPDAKAPQLLQYRSVCAIGDQLDRFLTLVPAPQRVVFLFDDLKRDPSAVYSGILTHLALPDDGRSHLPKENPNKSLRFRWLATSHRRLPQVFGPLYRPARALGRALGFSPSRMVDRLNVKKKPRVPLGPDFRARLEKELRPQIEKVSALLGRRLDDWTRPGGPNARSPS